VVAAAACGGGRPAGQATTPGWRVEPRTGRRGAAVRTRRGSPSSTGHGTARLASRLVNWLQAPAELRAETR